MNTTPSPITVGSNISYGLSVSNATGFNLNPGVITSEYGANARFVAATNLFGYTNLPGLVVFAIPQNSFPKDGVIDVFLELRGTNVGLLTNRFTVAIDDGGQTGLVSTNVVSTIAPPPSADLGITIMGPTKGVFPGDTFSYQLLATNGGPDAASGVVVSNTLPSNTSLLGLSPPNHVTLTNGVVLFSVGALTNHASAQATISVQAINAAPTNLISATISAANVTNMSRYTINVPILTPDTNQILARFATDPPTQEFNQQTGWMEQQVLLENVSTSNVESVRLLVGDSTNVLVNATGIIGTTPYVAHGGVLEPGGQVGVTLEFFNPSRTAGDNPTLEAYGTPPLDLAPEAGTGITVDRLVQITFTNLNHGRMLLEWPATAGAQYQVVYDEQMTFDNAKGSLPLIATPPSANRIQWLDYGPPRTLSAPADAPARFYKVIELP